MSSAKLRLETLRASFSDLASQLKIVLQDLTGPGLPPGPEIEQAIAQLRQDFDDFTSSLGLTADDDPLSLKSLEEILNNKTLEAAQEVVAKIERLRPSAEIDDPTTLLKALHRLLVTAREQCKTPGSVDDQSFQAEILEPLTRVITAIERRLDGQIELIDALHATLKEDFGMALALTLVTGRLEFGPEGTTYLDDLFADDARDLPAGDHDTSQVTAKSPTPAKKKGQKRPLAPVFVPSVDIIPPTIPEELAPPQKTPRTSPRSRNARSPIVAHIFQTQPKPPYINKAPSRPKVSPTTKAPTSTPPASTTSATSHAPPPDSFNDDGDTAVAIQIQTDTKKEPASSPRRQKTASKPSTAPVSDAASPSHPNLPQLHPRLPSSELVDNILQYERQRGRLATDAIAWKLLLKEEEIFALHIALGADKTPQRLEPRILRIAIIGTKISKNYGPSIELLRDDMRGYSAKEWFFPPPSPVNRGLRLLLAAGCLLPAVLAASTGAPAILRDLRFKDELKPLYDFCQEFADLCEQVPQVRPEQIDLKHDQIIWRKKAEDLRREILEWQQNAVARTTSYQRATSVWLRWQQDDGIIGELLALLLTADQQVTQLELDEVDELKKQLDDKKRFNQLVHDTDRELPAQASSKIEGRAIAQLGRYAQSAVELAQRWLTLHHQNPAKEQTGYIQRHVVKLRQLFNANLPAIKGAIERLQQNQQPSLYAQVGVRYFQRAIERVDDLFNADAYGAASREVSLDFERTLNRPLLRIPGLHLDDDWQPVDASPKDICRKILRAIKTGSQSFEEAFEAHLKNHDHIASYQILQVLESQDFPEHKLLELEEKRARQRRLDLNRLRAELEETQNKLNRIVAYGLIGESTRAKHSTSIDAISLRIQALQANDGLRFGPLFDQLKQTRHALTQYWEDEVKKVRARQKTLPSSTSKESLDRVSALLDKGDPVTANDYIDILERGDHLPSDQQEQVFDHFFHRDFHTIEELLNAAASMPKIRDGLRTGSLEIGPINLKDFTQAQRKSASNLFRAWFKAKEDTARHRDATKQIQIILNELGFSVEEVRHTPKSGHQNWYQVQTQPIRDQSTGQLPSFGSKVSGHYSVLCVNEPAREEEIVRRVGNQSHISGVFVFYFGKMSQDDRRRLANYKRDGRSASFLVLDDILLLWLCAQQPRLSAFFQAAFPFTNSRPFDITASFVPPEMFYGRAREMEELIDPFGSCFIYGGRQLGKTALLRHIVRERHNPQEGFIVTWIDLKAQGLGYNQKTDHIARVIAEALKQEGVIPQNVATSVREVTIYKHILQWLDEDVQRRILLLLDETDRFLLTDAQEDFRQCVMLKNIMEKSNRRFKVVFAGLHDVQRTTRQQNQPLAHLGEAICIGPLWQNGEWREALNLIRSPFHTMGFRFESADLPMRILAQTNFYPNLLQLYGDELLRHLHYEGKVSFDQATSPPYHISSAHLEEAYQSQSLRDSIRHKFKLTLELDPRYEIIAYVIAHEVNKKDVNAIVEGITLSHIRDQAIFYWPEGFANIKSEFSFRVLLEEMIGLGVLREVDRRRYTLRNSNVILLLGSLEEIEDELLRERELPVEYEPASFRAALLIDPKGATDFRRSPFTAEQESALRQREHSANIVVGNKACGLNDLVPWLKSTFNDNLHTLPDQSTLDDMERQLQTIREGRRGEGVELLFIPPTAPWDATWVKAACTALARLKSRKSFVRVLFGADPSRLWELTDEHHLLKELDQLDAFDATIAMEPWMEQALRRWCSDHHLGASPEEQKRLRDRTGNWPGFLYRFYRLHKNQDSRRSIADSLQKFEDRITTAEELRRWLDLLGIAGPIEDALRQVLNHLPSAFTFDELCALDLGPHTSPHQLLQWAKAMHIFIPSSLEKGASLQYEIAPSVSDLLVLSE